MDFTHFPLFPEWCVVINPETTCNFLGMQLPCVPAVTENTPFSLGIKEGHIWTFLALLTIGLYALSYVPRPFNLVKHPMKIATGLYSAETAFFALFRYYWGLGRPLVVGAALHNLFEWVIIILVANGTNYKNVGQSVAKAIFWIFGVVAVTIMVPDLLAAFLVEESTGIMLDFAMPLMFLYKYYFSPDPEVSRFYRYPGLAHTLHIFFTILPLVFATFHVGQVSWYNSFYLETAIFISAPMTHILYCIWARQYDRLLQETAYESGFEPAIENDQPASTAAAAATQHSAGNNGSTNSNGKTNGKKGGPKAHYLIPDKYRIANVAQYLRIGFTAGLLVLVVLPALVLGPCKAPPQCLPDGVITVTSIATVHPGMGPAFEDMIASAHLVELGRSAPGNLHYELVAHHYNKDEFRFIEKWASKEEMQAWFAGPPARVVNDPAMKGMLVGGTLHSFDRYYDYPSPSCRRLENGAVSFNVTASCSKVWSKVSDWSNCDWMIGCRYASVESNPGGDPKRIIAMDNGDKITMMQRQIDHRGRSMTYEYVDPGYVAGYTTEVALQDTIGGGCSMSVLFSVPKGPATIQVSAIYQNYFTVNIPGLQALFSR